MLKEIQINKTEKKLYCMDEDYHVYAEFPIGTDYYEGYNENGDPYSNVDDGVYPVTWIDIDYPSALTSAYGWGYINLDDRGRAVHGGGGNLGYIGAVAPYQDQLCATLGCFRMYNVHIFFVCHEAKHAKKNGVDVIVHVVS